MPVYKAYVNDKGNYIRARPSDTGNITYQTTSEVDEFLSELGYTDDDDLPWGIINPLRAAGLIYTEGQGTDQGLDDAPELDPSELATMSADEAEKLLLYLKSRGDVPDEIYDQLRETIEVNQKDEAEKLANALDSQTPESMGVSVDKKENNDDYDYDAEISIHHSVDASWKRCVHMIGILIESPNDEYDHRIMQWNVGLPTPDRSDPNIEKMTALNESKREIMRAMASLDGRSFDSRFSQHNRMNYAYVDYE